MYKLIGNSKWWFIFSGLLAISSFVFLIVFGLRVGIDYKGGTVLDFNTINPDRLNITNEVIKNQNITNFLVKEAGNDVVLSLPALSSEDHAKITDALKAKLSDYNEVSYDTVGPTIGKDLENRSILAVVFASIGIIFYIAYAFRKLPRPLSSWKFGLAAVIALIHDLFITTGIVALLGHFFYWMEVDVLFITALLTIMGFSVHDTIVVYDRLRENFVRNPHKDVALTAEESVNQTLVRSINTSLTVVLVLLALLLLGSTSIRHFIATLTIGIIIGTYSSIFVALPLVVVWHRTGTSIKAKSALNAKAA